MHGPMKIKLIWKRKEKDLLAVVVLAQALTQLLSASFVRHPLPLVKQGSIAVQTDASQQTCLSRVGGE